MDDIFLLNFPLTECWNWTDFPEKSNRLSCDVMKYLWRRTGESINAYMMLLKNPGGNRIRSEKFDLELGSRIRNLIPAWIFVFSVSIITHISLLEFHSEKFRRFIISFPISIGFDRRLYLLHMYATKKGNIYGTHVRAKSRLARIYWTAKERT